MSAIENATWSFMSAAKQTRNIGFPPDMIDETRQLRRLLLKEEYNEYLSAEYDNDLTEVCDGLADVIVIALGTLYSYVGWNVATEILNEVAGSNLSKVVDGKVLRRDDGKIEKGPNFHPPAIREILEDWKCLK